MIALLKYASSFLIWSILLTIIYFLSRRYKNIFLFRLNYVDFILLAMVFNAVFYLLGIKASDFFTSKFDELKYKSNEPWGVIGIDFFFDKIINLLLIFLVIFLIALRSRK